jgi:hypothetical protein
VSSAAIDEAKYPHASELSSADAEGACSVEDDVDNSDVDASCAPSFVSLHAAIKVTNKASAAVTRQT